MASARRGESARRIDESSAVRDEAHDGDGDRDGRGTSARWLTAESVAIATGIGYATAFLYQAGLAAYYGIPLETIRVSPEWVIFVGVALLPSVFLFLGHSTVSTAIEHSRHRRLIRWLLTILGLVLGGAAPFVGNRALSAIGMLVSVLLLSLAVSDWFGLKIEAWRRRTKKPNASLAALALVGVTLFLMVWVTAMGTNAASRQDFYLVDTANRRVLVYSTDSLYVFADYDASASALKSRLTFTTASSLGSVQLDYARTGRLKSAVLPH